ncbi:hypothetical protein JOD02_001523 [Caldicoprobacter guelmensis]|uniref:GerMN domain-containing protein n=1 Tax=Caldicoprobacter guelmensis TaxID=1170224 RepID=UPI00195ADD7E|nr:GerMN domain-containing protein [Caldicoprobacter guelmensis]MBM7582666.1 hypothetical protein [Caldicoprobacter guelmensis]
MQALKRFSILALILAIIAILTGCNALFDRIIFFNRRSNLGGKQQQKYINPEPPISQVNVTLYFKHYLADYLVPEKRVAQKGSQSLEYVVVSELLKGPTKFERVAIMPPNVKVLDVTRNGDTVFVNLSEEFKGNIDLAAVRKNNVPEEQKANVLAQMKRLCIYSIVNSLTELDGVNRVKILVNNRALSYEEIGAELIASQTVNVDKGNPVMALTRNKNFILSPSETVRQIFNSLAGEPDWERIDAFLARKNADGSERPPIEEIQKVYSAYIAGVEFDSNNFIMSEEIKPDGEAFVTLTYAIKYVNGKKESRDSDVLRVVNEEGIWKVRLPGFFANVQ